MNCVDRSSTQDVVVRCADRDDLEQLARLYVEFHEFHVRRVPDRLLKFDSSHIAELHTAILKIIEREDATVFVAEVDGQLVGLGEIYIREDAASLHKVQHTYGYLQSMMVTKAYRGTGIGSKILEAVELWAKEKNATEVRLDTWEFTEGPLEFYEKHGYSTLRRTLVRKLLDANERE
jgi:GNAT superfamily N-acetyltransferase